VLAHWSLLTVFDYNIISVMASNPKPHHIGVSPNRNRSIMDANPHRPKSPNLLKAQ
jgi:hypothetical protein